jgi:hypothetical protein
LDYDTTSNELEHIFASKIAPKKHITSNTTPPPIQLNSFANIKHILTPIRLPHTPYLKKKKTHTHLSSTPYLATNTLKHNLS